MAMAVFRSAAIGPRGDSVIWHWAAVHSLLIGFILLSSVAIIMKFTHFESKTDSMKAGPEKTGSFENSRPTMHGRIQ